VTPHRGDRPERYPRTRELGDEVPLPGAPAVLLVLQLAPGVGTDVLEAARVPDVGLDLVRDVIMPERDVIPLRRRENLSRH